MSQSPIANLLNRPVAVPSIFKSFTPSNIAGDNIPLFALALALAVPIPLFFAGKKIIEGSKEEDIMVSNPKNVVIVGAGVIGVDVFNQLRSTLPPSHRVVLIEPNNFAFWPIGALRAAVAPGWEDKVVAPLAGDDETWLNGKKRGAKNVLLSGTRVVEVRNGDVVLDKARPDKGFDDNVVSFDYLVIATGSSYSAPCRVPENIENIDQMKKYFVDQQKEIKSSQNILVVGGGAVGVEFAGEVLAYFPSKQVTLVTSGSALVGPNPPWKVGFTEGLAKQFEKAGGKLILDQKVLGLEGVETGKVDGVFETDKGEKLEADYILIATGNRANTSLLSSVSPTSYHPSGRLYVTPTLQLSTSDAPSTPVPGLEKIFVVGDANEAGDAKMAATGNNHIPVVSANILASINGGKQKEYKVGPDMMVVTFGPKGGAGQLFGMTIGAFLAKTIKSSSLFLSMFHGKYGIKK